MAVPRSWLLEPAMVAVQVSSGICSPNGPSIVGGACCTQASSVRAGSPSAGSAPKPRSAMRSIFVTLRLGQCDLRTSVPYETQWRSDHRRRARSRNHFEEAPESGSRKPRAEPDHIFAPVAAKCLEQRVVTFLNE